MKCVGVVPAGSLALGVALCMHNNFDLLRQHIQNYMSLGQGTCVSFSINE